MPKYAVIAHRRVYKLIKELREENLKKTIKNCISELQNYPTSLREMDVEKIRGSERTFRLRTGKSRVIFRVDKAERTIYVTHLEARKKAYTKLD